MPNYAIYARVSTKKQSTDPQVDELREIAEKKGLLQIKSISRYDPDKVAKLLYLYSKYLTFSSISFSSDFIGIT